MIVLEGKNILSRSGILPENKKLYNQTVNMSGLLRFEKMITLVVRGFFWREKIFSVGRGFFQKKKYILSLSE